LKRQFETNFADPAYPPPRQIIYLRVVQPRALIILKGAGKIHPEVRAFIADELALCVEVPAVELLPDGCIRGGSHEHLGKDVLEEHLHLGGVDPDVPLGPDSVATLSFTSGSTGIPKGVKGRHYSLTHFFPWMGERFSLGPQSKFTMLSGIAHDPIQRDSELAKLSLLARLANHQCSVYSVILRCRVARTNT